MSPHEIVSVGLSILAMIVCPLIAAAATSKMKTMANDIEDRVLAFIRQHEQDGFAHPNLKALEAVLTKLDSLRQAIVDNREQMIEVKAMLQNHMSNHQTGGK